MKTDLAIAHETRLKPIYEIAESLGLTFDDLFLYGPYIAKVPLDVLKAKSSSPDGKVILVTAMTPTKYGEGKTTTTIGLAQALHKLGTKVMATIREPSLGPCMGLKGGAAGGGYSQVLPMEEINLHFTGDLHAVTSAHNLLSALIDNHLHQGGEPELHPRKVLWKRVLDMNDRSLRSILVGLEGKGINGVLREDGFEITAASEIMAIWGLSANLEELKSRIGRIIIGYNSLRKPVTAGELKAQGAMAALLKNVLHPNLVQSVEGVPVFVHGGPFANIAHGCNTIIATRTAQKLADYVVTEAGFGADLGAEKFFHIKCRTAGINPSAAVLVVTCRAFAIHGLENIAKHVENLHTFGVPVAISINRFLDDPEDELHQVKESCESLGVPALITDFRESGGEGGLHLAEQIVELCKHPVRLNMLYELDTDIKTKVETLCCRIYGADGVEFSTQALKEIEKIEDFGYGHLPICMAKTPASLSDNPKLSGRPRGFLIHVDSAKVSAGAGFVVIYTGSIMTMPGLPKKPAALNIDVDDKGNITGLF